jgi:group I intron endonuclease
MIRGIITTYEKPPRVLLARREHDRSIQEISMHSISRTPSVYVIRHLESGKVYVGSARNPRMRCTEHVRALHKGVHHSRHLQNAWNKYGESAFVFEVIEPVLFVEDLLSREQYWMDKLGACDKSRGFNRAPIAGSTFGVKHTEEIRANMKRAQTDPERRAHLSALAKARWNDLEWRAKQLARKADPAQRANRSAGQRKRAAVNQKFSPKPAPKSDMPFDPSAHGKELWADPEYRARMTAAFRKRTPKEKVYRLISPEGAPIIVKNLRKFAEEIGLRPNSFSQLVCGYRKSYRGWKVQSGTVPG